MRLGCLASIVNHALFFASCCHGAIIPTTTVPSSSVRGSEQSSSALAVTALSTASDQPIACSKFSTPEDMLALKEDVNVTAVVRACPEACQLIYGFGNPDLSGIGVSARILEGSLVRGAVPSKLMDARSISRI